MGEGGASIQKRIASLQAHLLALKTPMHALDLVLHHASSLPAMPRSLKVMVPSQKDVSDLLNAFSVGFHEWKKELGTSVHANRKSSAGVSSSSSTASAFAIGARLKSIMLRIGRMLGNYMLLVPGAQILRFRKTIQNMDLPTLLFYAVGHAALGLFHISKFSQSRSANTRTGFSPASYLLNTPLWSLLWAIQHVAYATFIVMHIKKYNTFPATKKTLQPTPQAPFSTRIDAKSLRLFAWGALPATVSVLSRPVDDDSFWALVGYVCLAMPAARVAIQQSLLSDDSRSQSCAMHEFSNAMMDVSAFVLESALPLQLDVPPCSKNLGTAGSRFSPSVLARAFAFLFGRKGSLNQLQMWDLLLFRIFACSYLTKLALETSMRKPMQKLRSTAAKHPKLPK
eukprot:ANDGO_04354.mRNA.1 hypothetical protein